MAFPTLIVFPASDLGSATALYKTVLGIDPYIETPYYVGFRTETGEIGLDPNAKSSGPIPYWNVQDLGAVIDSLTAAGATVIQQPTDVGGGMKIAILSDTNANSIGFRQASN